MFIIYHLSTEVPSRAGTLTLPDIVHIMFFFALVLVVWSSMCSCSDHLHNE